jgi:hypothetical protein
MQDGRGMIPEPRSPGPAFSRSIADAQLQPGNIIEVVIEYTPPTAGASARIHRGINEITAVSTGIDLCEIATNAPMKPLSPDCTVNCCWTWIFSKCC